ncbi:CBS domain-containing protein [Thauera humireducens]|uniref:CBS domain-containing protein n=1 Tax=Thauera humireducens TaxID=1134435 RepID=UPI00311D5938
MLTQLIEHAHDCMDVVCVLDDDERLVGVLTLAALFALERDRRLGDAVQPGFPKVHATTDQERVASLALHHAISAIPVVDAKGKLLGVVPSAALMHILRREHVEDLHRFAGIARETTLAREAIEAPPCAGASPPAVAAARAGGQRTGDADHVAFRRGACDRSGDCVLRPGPRLSGRRHRHAD